MSEDEREQRLNALRSRVRGELGDEDEDEDAELVVSIDKKSDSSRSSRKSRRASRATDDYDDDLAASVSKAEFFVSTAKAAGENEWARTLAGGLILAGSILGLLFGGMLVSANPDDLLASPLFDNTETSDISGLVQLAIDNDGNGGDPVEGVEIAVWKAEGAEPERTTWTTREGRFYLQDLDRSDHVLIVSHPGNNTLRIQFVPGDSSELILTLHPGEDVEEFDWRLGSNLAESVALGTVVGVITIISALLGVIAFFEIRRAEKYRRTLYLSGLAMFSRGGIFIGPLLILLGMGLLSLTKGQFGDTEAEPDPFE